MLPWTGLAAALAIVTVGIGVLFGGCIVGEGGLRAAVQNRQTSFVRILVLTLLAPRPKELNGPGPVV